MRIFKAPFALTLCACLMLVAPGSAPARQGPPEKTNWEGTGVEPDVKVPADQALKTAQIMALKKAVEKTTDEELKGALRREIDSLQKEVGQAQVKK